MYTSNQAKSEPTLILTMEQSSSEKLYNIMNVSNGDLVFTEHPAIYGENLDSTEIIPVNAFNMAIMSIYAYDAYVKDKDNSYKEALEKFYSDWKNGIINDQGRYTIDLPTDKKGKNDLWSHKFKNTKGEVETLNFHPQFYSLFPETQWYYYRFFSACSSYDGPDTGKDGHLGRFNVDEESRSKYRRLTPVKGQTIYGCQFVHNPVLPTRWDGKNNIDNNIWKGGFITCYFIKREKRKDEEHGEGMVMQEFICEHKYGQRYLESGDERFKYYQPIGIVRQYDGGYAYDVLSEYLNIINSNTIENYNNGFKAEKSIETYLKKTREIKINIFN